MTKIDDFRDDANGGPPSGSSSNGGISNGGIPNGAPGTGSPNGNSAGGNPFGGHSYVSMPPEPESETERPDCLINYNEIADTFDEALFREEEMNRMVAILSSKKKANTLLVGEAGVGKTQLVEEFARLYVVEKDPVLIERFGDDLQIEELRISSLISGKSYVGQLEQEVEKVLAYAKENNTIIFIDELHRLFSDKVSGNVAQDLKQALARQDLKFIGATTTQEVTSIRQEAAFDRRWSDVVVDELTPEQTETILLKVKDSYETYHNVQVPDHLVPMIVRYGDMYRKAGSHRPDSGLTLLDRVCAQVGLTGIRNKQSSDPAMVQFLQSNPIPRVAKKDIVQVSKSLIQKPTAKEATEPIEDALERTIVGQANAKEKIASMVKRMKLNILQPKRPQSFLFAGPSGTGKTEMAKQLAHYLFGDEDAMIRLDMSEFSEASSINRIKGSPDGYVGSDSKQPLPFDALQSNPHQIVLLDELEKADKEVQLLFMQILDEGRFTTDRHNTIDFTRTIVIATTNAGVEKLEAPTIGFAKPKKKTQSDIVEALKGDFPIELINRFENIVAFDALTENEYKQILAIKYNAIIKEATANRPDLMFSPASIDPKDDLALEMLNDVAAKSFDTQLNGRPAERSILQHVEEHLLDHIDDFKQTIFEPIQQATPTPTNVLSSPVDAEGVE